MAPDGDDANADRAAPAESLLRDKIRNAEEEVRKMREDLAALTNESKAGTASAADVTATVAAGIGGPTSSSSGVHDNGHEGGDGDGWKWPLRQEEYERYGRQLILPSVGVEGQLRLKNASILFVGAGGLGCPAATYIAGAGVGTIGLVDGDVVEASNLHRQIAHTTSRVGTSKVDSVITYLKDLNPNPTYRAHHTHLTPENAESIISLYDLVLDCTDHPTSRYLVSDTCVLLSKPLVSAAAFKTDGQLIVLNAPPLARGDPQGGPCYRCVFPKPPPASSVVSCGEGGVLGPVVGVMGVLQALETIRLVASGVIEHSGKTSSGEYPSQEVKKSLQPTLLIFSSTSQGPSFRTVRMRGRRSDCFACSSSSTLTLQSLREGTVDYVRFCGAKTIPIDVLGPEERITAAEYASRHPSPAPDHVLLDVREKEHYSVAKIPGAVNVPMSALLKEQQQQQQQKYTPDWLPQNLPLHAPIYVVCRVGNDSQRVARTLKEMGLDRGGERFVGDIKGGMKAWKEEVDETLPFT